MEQIKIPDIGGDSGAQRQPPSPLLFIAALLFLTSLGAGAGGLFGFMLAGKDEAGAALAATAAASHGAAEGTTRGTTEPAKKGEIGNGERVMALPAIVTNLASPEQTRVRIEASVLLDGDLKEDAAALPAKIAEDIVAYLRTVPLAYFEGAGGFQNLREDLNDRSRVRSNGRVKDLIVQAFIIE
jgi:flagellar protein FliL